MCRHCVVVLQTLTGDVQALGGEGGDIHREWMCSKCKHIEGLCRHWCSVSTKKCGAANTERGYAGFELQTDA